MYKEDYSPHPPYKIARLVIRYLSEEMPFWYVAV